MSQACAVRAGGGGGGRGGVAAGAAPRVCVADPAGVCEDSAETALSLSSPVPLSTWPGTPVHGRTRERLETPAGQGGLVPKASPSAEPGAGPLLAGAGSAPGAQLTDDPAGQARGPVFCHVGVSGGSGGQRPAVGPGSVVVLLYNSLLHNLVAGLSLPLPAVCSSRRAFPAGCGLGMAWGSGTRTT